MKCASQKRALLACMGLAICFTIFSFRLIHLQVRMHDEYAGLAAKKHVNQQIIPARRGAILDINGEILADNEPVRTVVADCKVMADTHSDPAELASLLSGPLEMKQADILEKLSTGRKYVVLKKHVPEERAREIESRLADRPLRGIYFEQDAVRVYPSGSMLCHVLGFMNAGGEGVQGVEMSMDEYLRGSEGFRYIEHDRAGRELVLYRGQERLPRNGYNVRLTIDMGLQNIVESELETACAQFKPKNAIAILMRPDTGEILALANRPAFNPNEAGEGAPEQMKNCTIINLFEPGSTFKIVTAAAALNEKVVKPATMIFCENGHFNYAGKILHDHAPYGDLSVEDVLMKSSNIGAAKLAMLLGDQRFYEYIRRFGFGERSGIALPGEIAGIVHPVHRWSKISIARIPMGQGVAVTPIQTIAAMGVIANGGRLMMPQIVHSIEDEQGAVARTFEPAEVRQVISPETAKQVVAALIKVVSEHGTAALAKVSGFTVGGKTGTAQKSDPKGGYMPGKYVVSFVGFMPAEKPAFVGLVMLDEAVTPPNQNYGGLVAAPIFSRIAEKAARYMNLQPTIDPSDSKIILTKSDDAARKD